MKKTKWFEVEVMATETIMIEVPCDFDKGEAGEIALEETSLPADLEPEIVSIIPVPPDEIENVKMAADKVSPIE